MEVAKLKESWLPQLSLSKAATSCGAGSCGAGAGRFTFEMGVNPADWSTKPTTFYFASEPLTFKQAFFLPPHVDKKLFSNPFHAIRAASLKACDGTLLVLAPAASVASSVQVDEPDSPNIRYANPPIIRMAIRCSDSCAVWRLLKDVGRSFNNDELTEEDAVVLLNDILFRFENELQPGITLATSQTHPSIKKAAVR